MWLRHALKLFLVLIFISACSPSDRQAVDKLNSISYAYHYRNLDSTQTYAQRALNLADDYESGKAEALNNLAFVSIMQMKYADAYKRLDEVRSTTDNQIELLVADVQNMRLCQRESKNKDFYDYRESALRRLKRIDEEHESLNERDQARVRYAKSEFSIVASTYFYYVGLEKESVDAIHEIQAYNTLQNDTAQYLNYLYNVGAGGIVQERTSVETNQVEFDFLMRCFLLAQGKYPYFEAQAMQAISEHLQKESSREQLIRDNMPAMKFINTEQIPDDLLAGNLALRSLQLFIAYGDVYQSAGAYRTLAQCYWQIGDYQSSLDCLQLSLEKNRAILQAPDLVASIREQLSVVYAAMDDKQNSDINRNLYLDAQEQTRQDRQLEARAEQLDKSSRQLSWMIFSVVVMIVFVIISLYIFDLLRRKENRRQTYLDVLKDKLEEVQERYELSQRHIDINKRKYIEQRAKVSLVTSIMPFIDRIIHTLNTAHETLQKDQMDYIRELSDQINEYNEVLTKWIQMRQGELNLQIESFPLQALFDILSKGKRSFSIKGIELDVKPTTDVVKADRTLTLFMLNTLADNARKFTPKGGKVTISSQSTSQYVEISVADTGIGMSESQLSTIFDHQVIRDEHILSSKTVSQHSHSFGLMNCKGIIEKYRKVSRLFNVCQIKAESQEGEGSRFSFRLPVGVIRYWILAVGCWLLGNTDVMATDIKSFSPIMKAAAYADSAYFCNIRGNYERTLQFADSAQCWLDKCKGQKHLQDSIELITLDIRNESAVAALALHDWDRYEYNNKVYTQLFRKRSADSTLGDYVRTLQQSESDKMVAVILLILLLLLLFPAYYFMYYRHRLYERFEKNEKLLMNIEFMEDECRRVDYENAQLHVCNNVLDNCLSTLKHETMYYPSRIRQLADEEGDHRQALLEVVDYYKELYSLLSAQALRQVESIQLSLHISDYLFEILKKENGNQDPKICADKKDDKYRLFYVHMQNLQLSQQQCRELFTPLTVNVQYLICRQIVRDLGEMTHARGCGIRAYPHEHEGTMIEITLAHSIENHQTI